MHRVTSVEAKPDHVLSLTFNDGTHGELSMADRLFGPMFEPLRDFELFAQVRVDEYGAVVWPNGADLAPDALYQGLIMDRLEDVELNAITDARQDQSIIEVTLDEL